MKKIKLLLQKIINYVKSIFNKKTKVEINEEPNKTTEVRRLTYTKRTD